MTRTFPQRVIPTAPIGSLLKRGLVAAPRRARAEPEGGDFAQHLANIRRLPCLKCGMEPSEACHVRYASAAYGKASGLQKKPQDRWAVPLCSHDHRLARDAQHQRNEQAFWIEIDINPLAVATELWNQRDDPVAMQMVVVKAIAGRRRS